MVKRKIVQINGNIREPWRLVIMYTFFKIIPGLISSAVTAPVIVAYAAWIFIPLIPLQRLVGSNDFQSTYKLFSFIPTDFLVNNEIILQGWSVVTLIILLLNLLTGTIKGLAKFVERIRKLAIRVILGFPVFCLFIFVILSILSKMEVENGVYLVFVFLAFVTYLFLGVAWVVQGTAEALGAIYNISVYRDNRNN